MPRRTGKRRMWRRYVEVMKRAEHAALNLADALERYLRKSERMDIFQCACDLTYRYTEAMRAAEPYHFGTMPNFGDSSIWNLDPMDLLAFIRDLRGAATPHTVRRGRRAHAGFRYQDDGVAGFFRIEVRSMRRFGVPRRNPEVDGPVRPMARTA